MIENLPEPVAISLSVGQFLEAVNIALKGDSVAVFGEVMEFKESAKWVSFTLRDKDEEAILKCVMSVWQYRKIGVRVEDGMEIKVTGNPSVSKRWGSFAFWVENIEPLGEGSLKRAYDLLQKQLASDGLFARKRELPEFIRRVAVITSRDGVVIQDFRNNLDPLGISVSLIDTRVEGAGAVSGILNAIKYVARENDLYDVLVIMRGGGGLESMQAFNNEAVCRAIYALPIPVIAGIGHDVNVPLSAMVADAEVSTPTAAAHLVASSWGRLRDDLPLLVQKIVYSFESILPTEKAEVSLQKILMRFGAVFVDTKRSSTFYGSRILSAFNAVMMGVKRAEELVKRNAYSLGRAIHAIRERIDSAQRVVAVANPERNLRLGYSLVFNEKGKLVKDASEIKIGELMKTKLGRGEVESRVSKITNSK